MSYEVTISEDKSGDVVERMGPFATMSKAERVQMGANMNLNHEKYTVRLSYVETDNN